MPINTKYLAPFVEEEFFHVYNRTNGSHKLFRCDENYDYFIRSFDEYLGKILELYSYCLLPSHFHLIVKIKRLFEIKEFLELLKPATQNINNAVIKQFKSFFISYTMSFNKYHNRQGSLFNHKFRRVALNSMESLKDCIFYVHSNPAHHSLTKNFIDYPWSSYPLILSDEPTIIKREEVLDLFDGRAKFIKYHQERKPLIAKQE